jgi:hypothetical protein
MRDTTVNANDMQNLGGNPTSQVQGITVVTEFHKNGRSRASHLL